MAINDHEPEQTSMDNGEVWYFDQFGEYRNTNALKMEDEDLQTAQIETDEFGETVTPTGAPVADSMLSDDEFNQTLQSEYIGDQLNDPTLQREAESDYHTSLGDKIKDKFNDMRGK